MGSSAGSIPALLISLKCNYDEMLKYMDIDFNKLKDTECFPLGRIFKFIGLFGVAKGDALLAQIKFILKEKCGNPDITFEKHYK